MENTKQNSLENKAISPKQSTDRGGRAPTVESLKQQATSHKLQATSFRTNPVKPQATSHKLRAASVKQQALYVGPIIKRQAWCFAVIGE